MSMIERKYIHENRYYQDMIDIECAQEREEERVNEILAKYVNEDGIEYLWDKHGTELYGVTEKQLAILALDYLA